MVICSNCGSQAGPADHFCDVCGNPLAPSAMPPAPSVSPSAPLYAAPPSISLAGYPPTGNPTGSHPAAYPDPAYGSPSPYPGSPYARLSDPLAPPQPYAPIAQRPAGGNRLARVPRQAWIIGGVVLAVIVVAVYFFTRASSLNGEWYGPGVIQRNGSSMTTGNVYLNLQQGSNGSLTGSGVICTGLDRKVSTVNFTVSGTVSRSHVTLTIIGEPLYPPFSGTFSGPSMQLTTTIAQEAVALNLSRGSQAAFNSACQRLVSP